MYSSINKNLAFLSTMTFTFKESTFYHFSIKQIKQYKTVLKHVITNRGARVKKIQVLLYLYTLRPFFALPSQNAHFERNI